MPDGTIVAFTGGLVDDMNPPEVRARMDVLVRNTGLSRPMGLLHFHQTQWRNVFYALAAGSPKPLIVLGHSMGGAAAMNLAVALQGAHVDVDLLLTADTVLSFDDIGPVYQVPTNVVANINSYVIPSSGSANTRSYSHNAFDRILNIGMRYMPGPMAHRNAFYDLAGGDQNADSYAYPQFWQFAIQSVVNGSSWIELLGAAREPLQKLATGAGINIDLISSLGIRRLVP